MANLFSGAPDARQTDAPVSVPEHTLFRKRYRQLAPEELAMHDAIKDKADELALLFRKVACVGFGNRPHPDPEVQDNVTIAVRHLEDAVTRAVKALTA